MPSSAHTPNRPWSTTVGELAERIDVAPREVLDAAIAAGVQVFWHEGKQFRTAAYLERYLALPRYADPLPEVEFDLASDQAERLAAELDVEVERLQEDAAESADRPKPPRRMAASQQALADEADARRRLAGS